MSANNFNPNGFLLVLSTTYSENGNETKWFDKQGGYRLQTIKNDGDWEEKTFDKNGNLLEHFIPRFDEQACEIITEHDENGNPTEVWCTKYKERIVKYENNNPIETTTIACEDRNRTPLKQKTFKNGILVSSYEYDDKSGKFRHFENNKHIEFKNIPLENDNYKTETYENGVLVKTATIVYEENDSFLTFKKTIHNATGQIESVEVVKSSHELNNYGNNKKTEHQHYGKNARLLWTINYVYNENDCETEENVYDETGVLFVKHINRFDNNPKDPTLMSCERWVHQQYVDKVFDDKSEYAVWRE